MSKFDPQIRDYSPSLNRWDLSYYSRVTSRMGELTPVLCKRVIPSDRFRIGVNAITRLMPLANPVYDRVRVDFDAFFVQNRILDPDWRAFITGAHGLDGEDPTDGMLDITLKFKDGFIQTNEYRRYVGAGSLMDYLGYHFSSYKDDGTPNGVDSTFSILNGKINALPFLGYAKIYSDWYRNERVQPNFYSVLMKRAFDKNERTLSCDILNNISENYLPSYSPLMMFRRNYGKDPYTTALPEPLIGGPVPIMGGGAEVQYQDSNSGNKVFDIGATATTDNVTLKATGSGTGVGRLIIDLKQIATNTVQQLNEQYAIYKFFMKDTYQGNRYNEYMWAHYHVHIPDSTLERALFIGRKTMYIAFSEIFQTSGTTDENNTLGSYSGKGVGIVSGPLFDHQFSEHGYIYIIMSIVPYSTYFQGCSVEFDVTDRYGYYSPEFQNIGDAEVLMRRIFNPFNQMGDPKFYDSIFGYNRRWADYIYYPDELHGNYLMENQQFSWTFARKFTEVPKLGFEFSTVPSINSPFVYVADESMNYLSDIYFEIKSLRPIERYEFITTH